MKVMITHGKGVSGKNLKQATTILRRVADREGIELRTELYLGYLDNIPEDVDMVLCLYEKTTVHVPEVVKEFEHRLVFCETDIAESIVIQMLRSMNRLINTRRGVK